MTNSGSDERSITLVDAATGFSVLSVVLYVLGLSYWGAYFSFFGIPLDVLTLDLRTVLATTWPLALLLLIGFSLVLGDVFQEAYNRGNQMVRTTTLVTAIVALELVVLLAWRPSIGFSIYVLVGSLLIGASVVAFRGKRMISVSVLLPRSWANRITVSVIVFLALCALYAHAGEREARTRACGTKGSLVTIEVSAGAAPPGKTVLVAHLGPLYFVVRPGFDPSSDPVIAIPEENVLSMSWEPAD